MSKLERLHTKGKVFFLVLVLFTITSLFFVGCWGSTTTIFTVTFDSRGGSVVESIEVEKGDKITMTDEPEKYGYIFNGWYIDQVPSALWRLNKDIVTKDITLFAKWEIDDVVVNEEQDNKINVFDTLLLDYNENDYSPANWNILEGYINNAIANVNSATTVEEVAAIDVATVSDNCNAVLTLAQELANAKSIKNAELDSLLTEYTQSNYSPENWDALVAIINNTKATVTNATEIATVHAIIINDIRTQCDEIEKL